MNYNPQEQPTWDQYLRPLLELAHKGDIMRRTAVEEIADHYQFSEEIKSASLKSGSIQMHNRAGWAMSALVKAQFIQKHPTEKFTYKITEAGIKFLNTHEGAITDEDLKSIDGYLEAWEEASKKKQSKSSHEKHLYAHPFNILFPNEDADAYLDYFKAALEVMKEEFADYSNILAITLRKRSSSHYSIRLNVGAWATLGLWVNKGVTQWEATLRLDHPLCIEQGIETGFSSAVDGKEYALISLPDHYDFSDLDDLWDDIKEGLIAAVKLHKHHKASPYKGSHQDGLFDMILSPELRDEALRTRATDFETSDEEKTLWIISPGEGAKYWASWKEKEIASIGWNQAGDLAEFESLEELESAEFSKNAFFVSRMLWNMGHEIQPGDYFIAKKSFRRVLGVGKCISEYRYDPESKGHHHHIGVKWFDTTERDLPPEINQFPQKTLTLVDKQYDLEQFINENYLLKEENDIEDEGSIDTPEATRTPYTTTDALQDLFMEEDLLQKILRQLKRKKNIILEGAPGVGKTFVARRLAYLLQGYKEDDTIETVQFHQSYAYEDFMQGLRPTKDGGFQVKDGIFHRHAQKAQLNPKIPHFLIIDEINRGNLSKIFGELMMLIEADKRGSDHQATLTYADEDAPPFYVPKNLYLIGTMNTADKSLAVVDFALRRRFAFIRLKSGFSTPAFSEFLSEKGVSAGLIKQIKERVALVNKEICRDELTLGEGYEIGHSFFTPGEKLSPDSEKDWYADVIEYEVAPLLQEYFIDQPEEAHRLISLLHTE